MRKKPPLISEKRWRFAQEYVIDLNATKAAIRAGYSEKSARKIGSNLLLEDDVKHAIEALTKKTSDKLELSYESVLKDLQRTVDICLGRERVSVTQVVKHADLGTVEGVDVDVLMFEPKGAVQALTLLGKHLGMFNNRVEVTGANGSPLLVEQKIDFSRLTDDEVRTLIDLEEKASTAVSSEQKPM